MLAFLYKRLEIFGYDLKLQFMKAKLFSEHQNQNEASQKLKEGTFSNPTPWSGVNFHQHFTSSLF